jgi:hypothetical protein
MARIAALLTLAVIAAPVAAATPRPRLTVARAQPMTVRGAAFHRREHVRVVLRPGSGAAVTRHVTASSSGTFTVAFPTARLSRCAGWTVTATGAAGSRATLRRLPLPACLPA